MKYRQLGSSDLHVSEIGLGALHFGAFIDKNDTSDIISQAIELGVNFIDTAPIYGNGFSEVFVGDAVKKCRKDMILSTKVGLQAITRSDGTFGTEIARLIGKNIRKSVEKSLRALKTEYIDLLQIHVFDEKTPFEETLTVLSELIYEGKIRYVGCSNYNCQELTVAYSVSKKNDLPFFVAAQCHYNILERRAEIQFMPLCKEYGLGVVCNRTLARGILSGKYNNCHSIPKGSRADLSARVRNDLSNEKIQLVKNLKEVAHKRGYLPAGLALSWVLRNSAVCTNVVGVRNGEQLEECVSAHLIDLSLEDMNEIDAIITNCVSLEYINSRPDLDEAKKG